MPDGLRTSRKSLRLRLRCEVTVGESAGTHRGETVDVGAGGCRLVLPARLPALSVVEARIRTPLTGQPLSVWAKVVWVTSEEPWTHGLAFSPAWRPEGERWFQALTAANPELLAQHRVPEQIHLDQRLVVEPAHPDGPEPVGHEAELLRHAREGATVREVKARLGGEWSSAKRALFGLIDRGALSLDDGPSDPAEPAEGAAPRRRPNPLRRG